MALSAINVRWRTWLTEYQRRKAIDALPARFIPSAAEGLAVFGRWLAGASGIGVALAISAMFSSYTSLASVADNRICVASQFVSRTVGEGRHAALQFMLAGALALVAAAFPRAIWVLENFKRHDLLRGDTQPIPFGMWASEFSESKVLRLSACWQLLPLVIAIPVFRTGLDHAFGLHLSPQVIQSMWQGFKAACGH